MLTAAAVSRNESHRETTDSHVHDVSCEGGSVLLRERDAMRDATCIWTSSGGRRMGRR